MSYYLKSPHSVLDYSIDWAAGYLGDQIIVDSIWTIDPGAENDIQISGQSYNNTQATVTVAGGSIGRVYSLKNKTFFSDGRIDERSIAIRVEER